MSTEQARLGRYVIESELGRGAMGVVYRARDPRIDRLVALKTLVPDVDEEALVRALKERFLNEGRAAGRLSHPGVVAVYDADEDAASGTAYLAMEYVDGPDLRRLLRDGLSPTRLVEIVREVAAALDHAHQRGVVHRDVKPGNVLVDAMGRARLTDFGIARLGSSTMTRQGEFLGTPAYMAPEQILSEPVGPSTDIFALGVILYEGLTGQRPFAGDSMVATTHSIVNREPTPPSQARSSISPAFDLVIARALAKKPQDRYATAGELGQAAAKALASDLEETVVSSGSHGAARSPAGAAVRHRKGMLLALAGLLVLGPVAYVVSRLAGGSPADETPLEEPAAVSSPTGPTAPEPETAPAPETAPTAATAPKPAPAKAPAKPKPKPAPVAGSSLAVKISATRAGTLVVTSDRAEIGRLTLAANEEKGPKALGGVRRSASGTFKVPVGRHVIRFAFTNAKDGSTVFSAHERDFADGGAYSATLDVGMRGKDLDVKLE